MEGVDLAPGCNVTVVGLIARPELNGLPAVVVEYSAVRGRYAVRVANQGWQPILLKRQNLLRGSGPGHIRQHEDMQTVPPERDFLSADVPPDLQNALSAAINAMEPAEFAQYSADPDAFIAGHPFVKDDDLARFASALNEVGGRFLN